MRSPPVQQPACLRGVAQPGLHAIGKALGRRKAGDQPECIFAGISGMLPISIGEIAVLGGVTHREFL